jgi:LDH2 family malate/lactate/ureidoglycolate dehydrogenase
MTDQSELAIPLERGAALAQECFEGLGIRAEDAQVVAEVLLDANLHGVPSHGFQRVPIYMQRVHAGLARGTEGLSAVAEAGALCRIDADYALGPAAAVKALERALGLARQLGVGVVAVGRSTHFGAAGYYARRAAKEGFVSITITNATARMAPYGASEAFLGTNPLAIGIPLAGRAPFVLDIASSVAAQGTITRAKEMGTEIPLGLALDAQGAPTSDPVAALAGSLLPMAGTKGSGLALAIALLVVLLGEADCDDEMASLYNDSDRLQNTGHVFIAIEPSRLRTDPARISGMIDRLLALRSANAVSAIAYPGARSARLAAERRRNGVPLTRAEIQRVADACASYGLTGVRAQALALLGEHAR